MKDYASRVIAWHDAQAKSLNEQVKELLERANVHTRMAAIIRSDPGAFMNSPVLAIENERGFPSDTHAVNLKSLQDYLRNNGGRYKHVAKHFGVTEEKIRSLVEQADSGIYVADRGWLKLAVSPPSLNPEDY